MNALKAFLSLDYDSEVIKQVEGNTLEENAIVRWWVCKAPDEPWRLHPRNKWWHPRNPDDRKEAWLAGASRVGAPVGWAFAVVPRTESCVAAGDRGAAGRTDPGAPGAAVVDAAAAAGVVSLPTLVAAHLKWQHFPVAGGQSPPPLLVFPPCCRL